MNAKKQASGKTPRKLFQSAVVNTSTPGHRTKIEADLTGVSDLFLVVTDGGNGYACDWADWVDPMLHGPTKKKSRSPI